MIEFLVSIWKWLAATMESFGYTGVVALMALESSFFPFPSEIVVPPAAANAGSVVSLVLVIAAGIAGSLIGALFNYWLAIRLGRPFMLKYGRYVLISERTFHRGEAFFLKHGEIGTFVGRLTPGIRQVISFPAGLARMPIRRFLAFTALGSGIWVTVLALVGYAIGAEVTEDTVKEQMKQIGIYLVAGVVLLVIAYIWWHRRRRSVEGEQEEAEAPR